MPFNSQDAVGACTICGGDANILHRNYGVGEVVNCSYCGDYHISHIVADEIGLPIADPMKCALARHLIREMNGALIQATEKIARPDLGREFFDALSKRTLPTPAEATDNMVRLLAKDAGGRPGATLNIDYLAPSDISAIGVVDGKDMDWIVYNLMLNGWFDGKQSVDSARGRLTGTGWQHYEELQRAATSGNFAFFARQFSNPELDEVYETCLEPAVRQTGFALRPVTQRAGLIDAVIEDEIRRCRLVIADLSDDNAGAYWEAGFAEGLGKPVIYICKRKDGGQDKRTHFDANHRQTVRWDLTSLNETATQLKAVIRNTLLGAAKQTDSD